MNAAPHRKNESSGIIYYLDALSGNDSNNGTSKETAWKSLDKVNETLFGPGDHIYFKAGCSWSGQLWPKGSGSFLKPIVIDQYGDGLKPLLNGGGVDATVYLYNQEYWEIHNFEITNTAADIPEDRSGRSGVRVMGDDCGVLNYIRLKNLVIHHVTGHLEANDQGGINIGAEGCQIPTKFNDVLIEGCTIYSLDKTGIVTHSVWKDRNGTKWGNGPWTPFTNVVIRNNYVYDIGGDGFLISNCNAPLIEYNVLHDANARGLGYCDGFWSWNTDYAVFQFNEAYLTRTTIDGLGFDVDYHAVGTIFQYNYGHDNEGGFMLIACAANYPEAFNRNGIIRYNISQNDHNHIFSLAGNSEGTQIYNNTIYMGPHIKAKVIEHVEWGAFAEEAYWYNNVFYIMGEGEYVYGKGKDVFDSNVFYGNHHESEPFDPNKITEDPMLVKPGSGRNGIHSVDGYMLLEGSPLIETGKLIENNGGRDYWGNHVSIYDNPNRGAYNGSGVKVKP